MGASFLSNTRRRKKCPRTDKKCVEERFEKKNEYCVKRSVNKSANVSESCQQKIRYFTETVVEKLVNFVKRWSKKKFEFRQSLTE